MTRGGRRPKRASYRSEKAIELQLALYGFRRVPRSGALGSYDPLLAGDLRREAAWPPRVVDRLEVKRRKGSCRAIRKWLAQRENVRALVVETGGRETPLVVLPMPIFRLLLAEAHYDHEPAEGRPDVHLDAAQARPTHAPDDGIGARAG